MNKKGSEKKRHVVPWLNKAEWEQVRDNLFSMDSSQQRFALARISAWRARCTDSFPLTVESTAYLVRCQMRDRSGQLTGEDLIMMYAMALVKFVHLTLESRQRRRGKPLRQLARKLNIPEWVVDLRHAIVHHKFPSLKLCRKGCKVVLEWLQQEFWSRQPGGAPDERWDLQSDGEDEEADVKLIQEDELVARQKRVDAYRKARELLISYEKDQYQASDDGSFEDKEKSLWQAPLADKSRLLGKIKQFALESSELLIDVLLEDRFLVPTMEQLETLGCATSDSASPTEPRVPQTFLRFWLLLLKMLNSPSFIHLFLEKLFVELKLLSKKEPNGHRCFYISAWISEVLLCNNNKSEYHFETKLQKKARMKDRIFINRIQLRWQQLLSACLDAPCISTPHLIQLILDDMEHPPPQETREKLFQLCCIYTQTERSEDSTPLQQQPIYTVEMLLDKMQHPRQDARPLHSSPMDTERSEERKWAEAASPGASAPARPAEGLRWSNRDLNRLKCGLKLF